MSLLTDTWRGLVQRRLWPVALVLLVALAAVPFVLSEDPEPPAPVPGSAAVPANAELAAAPIVMAASPAEREDRRHVVGGKKDPFKPAPVKRRAGRTTASVAGASAARTATVTVPSLSGGAGSAGSAGSVPSAGGYGVPSTPSPSVSPAPAAPAPRKPAFESYSLTVRWGDSSLAELPEGNLERLRALPSVADPVVIYLGVLEDEETAVFMIDASVVAEGDGACRPSPADCQTIHLKAGETEFFDVIDDEGKVAAQYQLDLVKVRKRATASAEAAKVVANGGRALLRERLAQAARYRYDASEGVLEKLPPKAVKAKLARLARTAQVAGF